MFHSGLLAREWQDVFSSCAFIVSDFFFFHSNTSAILDLENISKFRLTSQWKLSCTSVTLLTEESTVVRYRFPLQSITFITDVTALKLGVVLGFYFIFVVSNIRLFCCQTALQNCGEILLFLSSFFFLTLSLFKPVLLRCEKILKIIK